MTIWHFSNSGDDTTGDGSIDLPYETLAKAEAVMVDGDTLSFNGGDTFRQNQFPGALDISASNITVNSYGTGKAIITPAKLNPTWTDSGINNEWWYYNVNMTEHRLVLENGVRMLGTIYEANKTAVVPVIGSLNAGEFAWDVATNRVYYKPTTGVPTDHTTEITLDNRAAISSASVDNITIDNIEVYGMTSFPGIFPREGSNIVIKNCYAHTGWRGIQGRQCVGLTIIDCLVDDVVMHGIGSYSPSYATHYATVARNIVTNVCMKLYDSGDCHAYVAQPGSTFNIFEYNYAENIGLNSLGEPVFGFGIEFDDVDGGIIRGNILKACRTNGIRQSARSGNTRAGAEIYSNKVIDSGKDEETLSIVPAGVRLDAQASSTITNPKIYDNVFYNNTFKKTVSGTGSDIQLYTRALASLTGAVIKNNIVSNSNSLYTVLIRTDATAVSMSYTFSHNCYHLSGNTGGIRAQDDAAILGVTANDQTWTEANILGGAGTWQTDHSQDANSITADPLFNDAANENFRLKELSPCNGLGVFIAGVRDKDGILFNENNPMIGCYMRHPSNKSTDIGIGL